jgi:hypothetical protein
MRNMMLQPIKPIRPISFTGRPNGIERDIVRTEMRILPMNYLIATKIRMIDAEIKSLERLNKEEHKLDILA